MDEEARLELVSQLPQVMLAHIEHLGILQRTVAMER